MSVYDDVLLVESDQEYHSKAGEYLSSHLLAEYARCPRALQMQVEGKYQRPDSKAFAFGRALHTLVLEGEDTYREQYSSGGPVNPTTGKPYGETTKKYQEWADMEGAYGHQVIGVADAVLVEQMARSVELHDEAQDILSRCSYRERVVRAECHGMPCQAKIDALDPESALTDLKTTRNLDKFKWQIRDFRYVEQLAFYRMVLRACGIHTSVGYLIAIEKEYIRRCGVWKVKRDELDYAEESNVKLIRGIMGCRREGYWPTNYEAVRELS